MKIRYEDASEQNVISEVIHAAFTGHPMHEPGTEPFEHLIVSRLRERGELSLSLVAEIDGMVVGHIALSPATVGGKHNGWFVLGPVGVLPAFQGKGVGSALVVESVSRLREQGEAGVVLVGDPGLYSRFGFKWYEALRYPGVPSEYVMALPLKDHSPSGDILVSPAFCSQNS